MKKRILLIAAISCSTLVFSQIENVNYGNMYISSAANVFMEGLINERVGMTNAELENHGDLYVDGHLLNNGLLNNYGTIETVLDFETTRDGSNESGATITCNKVLRINRNFTNDGIMDGYRDLRINIGSSFVNNGDVSITRHIFYHSTMTGTGTITMDGTDPAETQSIFNATVDGTPDELDFNNLVVNTSADVTVGGRYLSGDFVELDPCGIVIAGTLTMTSGDIRLIGESQLILDETSSLAYTSGELMRDREGAASIYGYHFYSSPVHNGAGNYSLSSVLNDGTDYLENPLTPQAIGFKVGKPYDGIPSVLDVDDNVTTPLILSNRWFYAYNETDGSNASYIKINQNTTLQVGQGFTAKGSGTAQAVQNYTYKGIPNDGVYTIDILNGDKSLVGNPYSSALDATQFLTDNPHINQLEFWVDGGSTSHIQSNYLGGFAVRNMVGGTAPNISISQISGLGTANSVSAPGQYVGVGQGFFVTAIADGTITFDNGQRAFVTEAAGDSNFYRKEQTTTAGQQTSVYIGYESPESTHRQLLLGFMPNNTNVDENFNSGYDAFLEEFRDNDLYFKIPNDDRGFIIQGVGEFDKMSEFEVELVVKDAGTHKFMLDNVENCEEKVYLFDKIADTYFELTKESPVELYIEAGVYEQQYYIVFNRPETTLNTDVYDASELIVYTNENEELTVAGSELSKVNSVEVYNTSGQLLISKNQSELIEASYKINLEASGLLLISVNLTDGHYSQKLIKD